MIINENTIFYIDEITGEKKIYEGDWKKLQAEAKAKLEKKNIENIKKDGIEE